MSIINDAHRGSAGVYVIARVPALVGAAGRRNIAQALADGGQPAMMVMAAPYAVAAFVAGLFGSDSLTAAYGLAPPP